jgi:hypothetical protein
MSGIDTNPKTTGQRILCSWRTFIVPSPRCCDQTVTSGTVPVDSRARTDRQPVHQEGKINRYRDEVGKATRANRAPGARHQRPHGKAAVVEAVLDTDVDTTTAAGRLLVDVVSAAASFESRRIRERAKSVHAVRRAEGKRSGQAPILP